jgi:protein-tyrosine-phosphatase
MLTVPRILPAQRVVFVCTRNSARSQLAAALRADRSIVPAASAGTHPGPCVRRRAIDTAGRHEITLRPGRTAHIRGVVRPADLIVAVCDSAYEVLRHRYRYRYRYRRLRWPVPDPAPADTDDAFERALRRYRSPHEPACRCSPAGNNHPGNPDDEDQRTV